MPGICCSRRSASPYSCARVPALGDAVGNDPGESLGLIDCVSSRALALNGPIRLRSPRLSFVLRPLAVRATPLPHGVQPLTRSIGCFSGIIHEEGHHGTRGQKLCQTSPQNYEAETTQLPPLRPRILVGGSTSSLVPNMPASHRRLAIAGRRVQRLTSS
jgi:hypothetical protein